MLNRCMLPYIVDCIGLSEDDLGYPAFPQELNERRDWCHNHCYGDYHIEPIRRNGQLIGRRFEFLNAADATQFKLLFPPLI